MDVVIVLEHHFVCTPDRYVWTQTTFPYSFWMRYLEVFDNVRVVARIGEVASVSSDWKRADGECVSFIAVPDYLGPWQYLQRLQQIKRAAKNAVGGNDAVILRVSSQIASCIQPSLLHNAHPYAVEVVGDPYDVFAPGSVKHPLRPFFRWQFPRQLQHQCAGAFAAAYVTKYALQKRYPCPFYSVGISDVDLPDDAFIPAPRRFNDELRTFTLIFVGTLAQMYKAPNNLIDAVSMCVREGLDIELVIVGDGKYRDELEVRVKRQGLGKQVHFLGQLTSGNAVREQLDRSDLFVLPSYQEGLPRAMVEAMARSLPCIGSTVGGIPELLSPEDMVHPGDVEALANKIHEVIVDPKRLTRMSACNLEKAKEYRDEVLHKQRIAFYRHVRKRTKAWLATKKC